VPEYITSVTALVKLAKVFGLPTVITTSAADGPNGPPLPVITQTLPGAPVIHRPSGINARNSKGFLKKTGRRKLIIAGVSTEVCVAFVALSAVKEGFDACAVIDASGTWNKLMQEVAVAQTRRHGRFCGQGAHTFRGWFDYPCICARPRLPAALPRGATGSEL
jgi:nicotinamidase-related amidase